MECRKFEMTLISAHGLAEVRKIGKMKVHARVSVGSIPETEKRTPTDTQERRNPSLNYTIEYTIKESLVQHYTTMLVVKLYCKRELGDRYIGEVNTTMKEIFDNAMANGGTTPILTFPVTAGCVKLQGELELVCRFGKRVIIDNGNVLG